MNHETHMLPWRILACHLWDRKKNHPFSSKTFEGKSGSILSGNVKIRCGLVGSESSRHPCILNGNERPWQLFLNHPSHALIFWLKIHNVLPWKILSTPIH